MVKSIIKDTIILCLITLVCGALLGEVYSLTKQPIEDVSIRQTQESYQAVMSDADAFEEDATLTKYVNQQDTIFEGRSFGKNGVTIDSILSAKKEDQVKGYIFTVITHDGYGGDIKLVVGMDDASKIVGIEVLSIDETVGLGMRAKTDASFKEQFLNKEVEAFKLVKTGSTSEDEVDALSGATITSTAYTNAINATVYFYAQTIGGNA